MQSIDQLLAKIGDKTVLCIGDLMLDEFLWGKVSRISPEAPVPVVEVIKEEWFPGGAANVARNTALFFPEAGLADWPAWSHEAIGLAALALAVVPIVLIAITVVTDSQAGSSGCACSHQILNCKS